MRVGPAVFLLFLAGVGFISTDALLGIMTFLGYVATAVTIGVLLVPGYLVARGADGRPISRPKVYGKASVYLNGALLSEEANASGRGAPRCPSCLKAGSWCMSCHRVGVYS